MDRWRQDIRRLLARQLGEGDASRRPAKRALVGKYRYNVATETPARDATLVVVSRSFPSLSKT